MARGRKSSLRIVLSPSERETLERWQHSTTLAAGLARRGRLILLLATGHSQSYVAQMVGVQRGIVRKWAKRFRAQRLDGLVDAPGRGAKGFFPPRSRDPLGATGLRAPRRPGSQPLPMGLPRTGAPARRRRDRDRHLGVDGATDFALTQTQALAPSSLAPPQEASGRRVLCHCI
jgi:helix-turn-helix protein